MDLVHRTAPQEVIPTGWERLSERRFLVRGRWNHPYYTPAHGLRFDPLLIVESMRQSTILISHGAFDVPIDHKFVLQALSFDAREFFARMDPGGTDVELEVSFSKLKKRNGALSAMHSEVTARYEGRHVATGAGSIDILSPRLYNRLRGAHMEAVAGLWSAPGASVQGLHRTRADDVVVVPTRELGVWELLVDTRHPTFFQRPNDHVPGMLVLEAARQVARSASAPRPFVVRAGDIAFSRYAELSSPVLLRVGSESQDGSGLRSVSVTGEQDGSVVFEARLEADARW